MRDLLGAEPRIEVWGKANCMAGILNRASVGIWSVWFFAWYWACTLHDIATRATLPQHTRLSSASSMIPPDVPDRSIPFPTHATLWILKWISKRFWKAPCRMVCKLRIWNFKQIGPWKLEKTQSNVGNLMSNHESAYLKNAYHFLGVLHMGYHDQHIKFGLKNSAYRDFIKLWNWNLLLRSQILGFMKFIPQEDLQFTSAVRVWGCAKT